MNHLSNVPAWVAVIVAAFALIGAMLTLLGVVGLVRLSNFYDRLHAPTLGTSWGAGAILLASAMLFTAVGSRPVFHELVIGIFIIISTAVTMVTLAGAAAHRDGQEGAPPGGARRDRPEDRAEPPRSR